MTGSAIAGSRLDVDTEELVASCLSESAVSASNKAVTLKETTCDATMGRKAQGAGCYSKTHSSRKLSCSLLSHPYLRLNVRCCCTEDDLEQPFSKRIFLSAPLFG